MEIISIVNQKGGVGKTTTTVNLAAALAKAGKNILVVDLDPQRNATTSLNEGTQYEGFGVNDLIYFAVSRLPFAMDSFIRRNEAEGVDYIPATPMLASAPNILAQDKDSCTVLHRLLRLPELEERYDHILLDCKPSMDLLVSNALVASDRVIVPVMPEAYALDGLGDLMDTINSVQDRYNEQLQLDGILITRANMKRKVTKQTIEQLRETFGATVYKTVLPDLADCANAQESGRSMVNSIRMTAVNSAASCGKDGTCPLHGFTDVKAEEWYHDGVHYCLDTGLISGVTADSFLPEGGTLRTVAAAALWKLEGSPAVSYAADYSDVPDEGKYVEAIRWVASAGIMTGYGDGRFGLEDPITREQLAAVLCRYAAYKGYELSTEDPVDLNSYHDAPDISEWAVPAMQLACNAGLIQGTPEGNLIPLESTTRAQAATIFMRFRENVVN